MKNLLRVEEVFMLMLAIYLSTSLPYAGWLYWALFLTPDIGLIGYVFGSRTGAFTYNLLHHKGIAVAFYLAGAVLAMPSLQFAGLLLLGHSSFDRVIGYGLKFQDSFHNTHLGVIGRSKGS